MTLPYSVKITTELKQAMSLENSWRALTDHATELQCFMSWEWLSQWLHTYQEYVVELNFICVLYNNECVAIAPFYIGNEKILGINQKTLSLIATNEPEFCEVASEFIDIAHDKKHKQQSIDIIARELKRLSHVSQFSFRDISSHSLTYAVSQQLKTDMLSYNKRLLGYQFQVNINSNAQLSNSFLKKKKRLLNKFNKLNKESCQFSVASTQKEAEKLFKHLIKLHQQRWQNKGKLGVFADKTFLQFHQEFIRKHFNSGMIVLSAIKMEEKVISVNYSIKWQNALYFYQSGIDDTFKPNISPGLLNHLLVIDYCETNEIYQYNLLKSAQKNDYKGQFSQLGNELFNVKMLSFNRKNLFLKALQIIKKHFKKITEGYKK